jgi:hypothetical protein
MSAGTRADVKLLPGADGAGNPSYNRVEFAARDAPPTPAQLERVLPAAKCLFPLGDEVEATSWGG